MSDIKQSAWKLFNVIKEEALDAFCNERLQEYEGIIKDSSRTALERYRELYQVTRSRDKEMARLFDGHSRGNAYLQLLEIRKAGLANQKWVDQLSDEFKSVTDPLGR